MSGQYVTKSSSFLYNLPIQPSSALFVTLSKKLYKRAKRFRKSVFINNLQPSLEYDILTQVACNAYCNMIKIEDWKYLLSFNSSFVKFGNFYFPDKILISTTDQFESGLEAFFDTIGHSEHCFISFVRYLMLRLKCNSFSHSYNFFELETKNIFTSPSPSDEENDLVEDTSSDIPSTAFTLKLSEVKSDVVKHRLEYVTSLAPILVVKLICKYAQSLGMSFITTLIEELRIGIDRLSLISIQGLNNTTQNSLLYEVITISLLCRLISLLKDINALIPALLKTTMIQLVRLARLGSSHIQKQSHDKSFLSKDTESTRMSTEEKDESESDNSTLSNTDYSSIEESIFVFDGSLFVLKSSHLFAKLICSLLSVILGHPSIEASRQDMYAYFVSRLLNAPSTASSSIISGNGLYIGGSLIPFKTISSTRQLVATLLATTTTNGSRGRDTGESNYRTGKRIIFKKIPTLPNVLLKLKLSRERIFHKGDSAKGRKLTSSNRPAPQDTNK